MASRERVLLIGGGLTTARAAESLRQAGFDGEVVVLAEERRLPYERPPLSKGYLTGADAASVVYPHDAAWYRDHDVDVRRGVRATAIDPSAHTVSTSGSTSGADAAGEVLRYDRLLLATGSSPRRFDGPGAGLRDVHTLRRLPDSTRLRTAFRAGDRRVVVVGGGWIGLEAAAAAREYGNEVTVLVRGEVPLAAAIGPELGGLFQRMHEEHGVTVRTGTGISALSGEQGRVAGVVLGTGEEVPADLVLFGIGATPNVELAASAGLTVDDGIVTDAAFGTSADDIYAAGDVAKSFNPRLGHWLRVDHWANALNGGALAGRAIAGETVVYDDIPYFFTDQYDLGMEYSGYGELAAGAELVVRGDLAARECVAFWLADGRVVAGMNINVWDVNETVQRLIRSERIVSREELADPGVPLDALAGDVA
ncbi:3-phenylpropionate/trans-cinnamate dioxygenase ferredoxin reductase subunit [Agromyces ramosus]|uniref:3-phenylpropionate/trans-cinnamate dioxygenase ferredoxin reductase subunit n=1 Tax=Agromyces ramosus TaxID=33879 RepID=A0A4Q7MCP3_9MICO|nr:FAD-dependent oxidoreductase [Agromyces ramosus]RZS64079.1 3-phenylpropionate/trans-cinnamate dioxygenase ferredoxin reductase subunit [Agromyces ramosus]